jgi:hypothetical protein
VHAGVCRETCFGSFLNCREKTGGERRAYREDKQAFSEVFAVLNLQPVEDDGLVFDASSVKVTEIRDTQE